jgi:hypothetical protein
MLSVLGMTMSTSLQTALAQEPPGRSRPAKPEAQRSPTTAPAGAPQPLLDPIMGSPEWEKKQAEEERRERDINRRIRSICNPC